jgi:hypothetical protein
VLFITLQYFLSGRGFLLRLLQRLFQQPQLSFMLCLCLLYTQAGDKPSQQQADSYPTYTVN